MAEPETGEGEREVTAPLSEIESWAAEIEEIAAARRADTRSNSYLTDGDAYIVRLRACQEQIESLEAGITEAVAPSIQVTENTHRRTVIYNPYGWRYNPVNSMPGWVLCAHMEIGRPLCRDRATWKTVTRSRNTVGTRYQCDAHCDT
jgi:hypothetical protein